MGKLIQLPKQLRPFALYAKPARPGSLSRFVLTATAWNTDETPTPHGFTKLADLLDELTELGADRAIIGSVRRVFGGGSSLRDSENVADAASNPALQKAGQASRRIASLRSRSRPDFLCRYSIERPNRAGTAHQITANSTRKLSPAAAAGEIPPGSAILRVSP